MPETETNNPTKMIERYVIMDNNNVTINNVDEIRTPHSPGLHVVDLKNQETIATMDNGDKDENFVMAKAVVDALNNYPAE